MIEFGVGDEFGGDDVCVVVWCVFDFGVFEEWDV